MNDTVNCVCYCNIYYKHGDIILFILPCNHIVHQHCFNEYLIKSLGSHNTIKCPLCDNNISLILNETQLCKKKYKQQLIDIKSVKSDASIGINYLTLPLFTLKLTTFMNKLLSINTKNDILSSLEYVLRILNIKINIIDNTKKNPIKICNNTVKWLNNDDIKRKKIIIANHSHFLDAVILYYLFRAGIISSEFINKTDIGRILVEKMNILIFKRGIDTNMVEKIKQYMINHDKLIIFPEGMISHHDTIIQFRTGAFHVGESVCPIVIKYKPLVHDDDFSQFLMKIGTHSSVNVDVYINDLQHPPFNTEKIEHIRDYMAKIGKLDKSRVSNKSIKEH